MLAPRLQPKRWGTGRGGFRTRHDPEPRHPGRSTAAHPPGHAADAQPRRGGRSHRRRAQRQDAGRRRDPACNPPDHRGRSRHRARRNGRDRCGARGGRPRVAPAGRPCPGRPPARSRRRAPGHRRGPETHPDDLLDAPLLEDWRPETRTVRVLAGRVHGHPNFPAGRPIVTSDLYARTASRGHASLSRWYRLGVPATALSEGDLH